MLISLYPGERMSMFTKRFIWLAVLAMLLPVLAWSQATSGDLVGTVLDKSGAAVPNASITAVNQATGVKSTAVATNIGSYRVPNLLVGTYSITASAPGFAPKTIKGIVVELNKTSTVNVTIEPGQVATTVEVQASAAPPIDTTTAQLESTYDNQQAQIGVSSLGQGVYNLALLQPGVTTSGGLGYGTGPSVAGQRPTNNSYMLEGVDNNRKDVTGPATTVPNDAVAEFSVLANQFSPEFGHSSGAQMNVVISSGSNTVHGKVYEYFQNKNLMALDTLYRQSGTTEVPRYDNNRMGGSIGGPIIKNKLFYYGLFEYNPIGQVGTPGAVCTPSAAGYATLDAMNAAGTISATNYAVFKKYLPVGTVGGGVCNPATVNGVTIDTAGLNVVSPNWQNHYNAVGSIDYNISEKDQLRGRWIYNKEDFIDNTAQLPVFFNTAKSRAHTIAITEFHTFNPNVTNEMRIGYNRVTLDYPVGNATFPGLSAFPNLTFNDLGLDVGPDDNAPQNGFQNTYQLTDNVTWMKGAHTLKMGFDGIRTISPSLFVQRLRGDYEYKSIGDYLTDLSPTYFGEKNISVGDPTYWGNQWSYGFFANDSWKVNQHLTLNYGLRYEFATIPTGAQKQSLNSAASVPGLIDFVKPNSPTKNFAPRFGFAYAPGNDAKTSIRGGIGMAYDVLYDNLWTNSKPPQQAYTLDVPSVNNPTPNFLADGGLTGSVNFPSVAAQRAATSSYIPVNQKDPYTITWNLGVQRVFADVWTADVRYVGTHGMHMPDQQRLNIQNEVSSNLYLPTFFTAPTAAQIAALTTTRADISAVGNLNPLWALYNFTQPVVADMPYGASIYHGLQTSLERRFTKGLQMTASYTWSHAEDNSTANLNTTSLTPRRPEDFENWHKEWANSILDRRHRLTISAIYETSFKTHGLLMKNLLDGWNLQPQYVFESPEYATVQSGVDSNGNGDSAGDRAILNPNGKGTTSTGVTPICNASLPAGVTCGKSASYPYLVGYVANDPTATYVQAGFGALTNTGRNTMAMPRTDNVNFSMGKKFYISERMNFEFQAQAFNLLNHPQWIPGSLFDVGAYTSTAATVRPIVTTGSATFNKPWTAFSSNPRYLQLVAKINF